MRRASRPAAGIVIGLSAAIVAGGCAGEPYRQLRAKPKAAAQPAARQPNPSAPAPVEIPEGVNASEVRERAVALIVELSRSTDQQVRANACEASLDAAARLSGVIERGLTDPNAAVRSVAAVTVGRARLKGLVEQVRPLMNETSPYVRSSAIFALIRCGQDVDRTPLASMLLDDPSPWVRRHVAYLLGELGDQSAVPLLRSAAAKRAPTITRDQAGILQLQIAESMIKLGEEESRQVVRASLYPSRPDELEAAAFAVQIIGEVKDRDAISQLIYLADFRDTSGQAYPAEVRLGIAATLARLGVRGSGNQQIADDFAASTTPAHRAQAAFVYGLVGGPPNLARLDQLMNDPEGTVRIAAAAAALRAANRSEGP